jgi:hypothetical protein
MSRFCEGDRMRWIMCFVGVLVGLLMCDIANASYPPRETEAKETGRRRTVKIVTPQSVQQTQTQAVESKGAAVNAVPQPAETVPTGPQAIPSVVVPAEQATAAQQGPPVRSVQTYQTQSFMTVRTAARGGDGSCNCGDGCRCRHCRKSARQARQQSNQAGFRMRWNV